LFAGQNLRDEKTWWCATIMQAFHQAFTIGGRMPISPNIGDSNTGLQRLLVRPPYQIG
jgi:hypothetical protein